MKQHRRTAGQIALHDALVEQNTPRFLNMNFVLSLLLGGGLLAFLFWPRKADVAVIEKASSLPEAQPEALAVFREALNTTRAKPYADMILTVAFERASYGVKPLELATMLYGLGEAETHWGTTSWLDRKGPDGCGDYILRCYFTTLPNGTKVQGIQRVSEKPAGWKDDGRSCANGWMLPTDGRGFGRGLMQIDYVWNYEWAKANEWWNPLVNIRKAADLLMAKVRYLSEKGLRDAVLKRAAIAAYNAGEGRVFGAIRAGKDPDSVTYTKDYSKNVLAYMRGVTDEYEARGGVLV